MSTPPTLSPLQSLAQRMGIAQEFEDAHGKTVQCSEVTNGKLLQAMGVGVTNDAEATDALAGLDQAEWLRALPGVRVLRSCGRPLKIEVCLPVGTGTISWRLQLEEGGELDGEAQFTQLELLATRTVDGHKLERRALTLPPDLPYGYHTLKSPSAAAQDTTLIITPERCWLPRELEEGTRIWGIAAQLYLLRSGMNWGIGDFGDLRRLVDFGASHGADVIGLNPLHALFPDDPEQASPYSPASRLMLNPLYIDLTLVPELRYCEAAQTRIGSVEFQQDLARCRADKWLDYSRVCALKLEVLPMLFDTCRAAADKTRWQAFNDYKRDCGEVLEQTCIFFALRERFAGAHPPAANWHDWPAEFQDCHSPAVRQFALDARQRVDFFAWLQWVAETQLSAAAQVATGRRMRIGLYRDLAVGADSAGAETWVSPKAFISGTQVGAPPDLHNPAGQNWGLPPFNPRALRDERYQSFVSLIRTNMRCAGGLRIDHVMGLQQLYCIPAGLAAHEGAYIRYPLEDLVGILALESHRQRCIVVGEDLGTVTAAFRESMSAASILSYRVVFFEQNSDTGAFVSPADYPELAVAVSGNHDLPTLRGWWDATDIETKHRLGLYPTEEETAHQRSNRERDKQCLLKALRQEGLLTDVEDAEIEEILPAVCEFLARTRSGLALLQIDDLTEELEQVNVPATSGQYPNWRRRLSVCLEDLPSQRRFTEIVATFAAQRAIAPCVPSKAIHR